MPFDYGNQNDSIFNAKCENCGQSFTRKRKDKRFCSEHCRKDKFQKKDRKINPRNSKQSNTKRRENEEIFDKSKRLSEQLYSLPPSERLGYLKDLIDLARRGETKLRSLLTNKYLLSAGVDEAWLFPRRCPRSYRTISQAANSYCIRFWNASIHKVVRKQIEEPETGEILEESRDLTPKKENVVKPDGHEFEPSSVDLLLWKWRVAS